MIIWVRNIVVIFVLLSAVYVVLSFRAGLKQRAKLKADFIASDTSHKHTGHDNTLSKEEFVANGMRKYNRSLKPKLVLSVYLIPLAIMAVLIYLVQYT